MTLEENKKIFVFFLLFFVSFIHGCARAPHRLSSPSFVPSPVSTTQGITHTVERGQTLYRIAKTYDVEVSDLMRTNNIYNPSQLEVGQKLMIPRERVVMPPKGVEIVTLNQVRSLVGPRSTKQSWQTITLHHSGTLRGSARLFDRDHRRRRMGGLFYHFVIGNGSYTKDGSIEVGWRWKKQVKANRPFDIQICLVGNFNKQTVSEAQLSSLANLITVLQEQYEIPLSHVRRHEDIKGKITECPGRNFPFNKLISRLGNSKSRFSFF